MPDHVLEALASGVPVVQPRHGVFPELLSATGGGILCQPNDAAALADALEELLLDEPRRRELAQTGRARVAEQFDINRMAQRIAEVYDAVRIQNDPTY